MNNQIKRNKLKDLKKVVMAKTTHNFTTIIEL